LALPIRHVVHFDWHDDAALDPDQAAVPVNPKASCYPQDADECQKT
jgi:hypothetical protein